MLPNEPSDVCGIVGQDRLVTVLQQRLAHVAQHVGVVVDGEDALGPVRRPYRGVGRGVLSGGCAGRGLVDGGDGEDEPGAAAAPLALGPDAAPVGLHDALADGQAQAVAVGVGLAALAPGELGEQRRQALGGYARTLVDDRDDHMPVLARRDHVDGGPAARVPGGVGQEVEQDLRQPLAVGPDRGQVADQLHFDVVVVAAADERVPGLLDDGGDLGRLGRHGQGPRLDARQVQKVADQVAHVVGLLLDYAEELLGLRGIECHGSAPSGGRGPP